MTTEWDGSRAPVVLQPHSNFAEGRVRGGLENQFEVSLADAKAKFREFLRNYRLDNVFLYRDMLNRRWRRKEFFVEVDLAHLNEYDEVLFNSIQTRPEEIIPMFEAAAKDALVSLLTGQSAETVNAKDIPNFQVILSGAQVSQSLRSLTAEHLNNLVKIPGIVISCTKTRSKATVVCFKCSKCAYTKLLHCKGSFGGASVPKCDRGGAPGEDCGPGSFVVVADNCEYVDQQTLKLQVLFSVPNFQFQYHSYSLQISF